MVHVAWLLSLPLPRGQDPVPPLVDYSELNSLASHIRHLYPHLLHHSFKSPSIGIAQNFLDEALSQSNGFLSSGPTLPHPDATGQRVSKYPAGGGGGSAPALLLGKAAALSLPKAAAFCFSGPVTL